MKDYMTISEIEKAFYEMCDEWFGNNGYSQKIVRKQEDDTFSYILVAGVNEGQFILGVEESNQVHSLELEDDDDDVTLHVSLHTTDICIEDRDAVFWAMVSIISAYFRRFCFRKNISKENDYYFVIPVKHDNE